MTKVLVTAEAFGFGPASKLHAICVELARRGIECHFAGEMSALTFAQSNAQAFGSIVAVESMSELASVAPDGFDATLSVMDPYLTVWSSFHNVPCVYVDSLYWFWQWSPENEADLRKTAAELLCSADGAAGALRSLDAVPMHDGQYIAHYLSAISCAQRAPKSAARATAMSGIEPVQIVDAVIDLSYREFAMPTRWLATASGMLNPLYPVSSALDWVMITARLLDEAATINNLDEPILLAGHPDVLALATDIVPSRIQLVPLDHQGILRDINEAIACLTPAGLTTMLECSAYGTPVILLPEQHYGHLSNYREMTQCCRPETFPHALINPDAEGPKHNNQLTETLSLSQQLRLSYEERGEVWARMVSGVAKGMLEARDDRERLRAAQDDAARGFVGGYGGASQVADAVELLLGSPSRDR
jgi:hypothetical protein